MLSWAVKELADPHLVARFQRWCGVELDRMDDKTTSTTRRGDINDCGKPALQQPDCATRLQPGDVRHRHIHNHAHVDNTECHNNNNQRKDDRKIGNGAICNSKSEENGVIEDYAREINNDVDYEIRNRGLKNGEIDMVNGLVDGTNDTEQDPGNRYFINGTNHSEQHSESKYFTNGIRNFTSSLSQSATPDRSSLADGTVSTQAAGKYPPPSSTSSQLPPCSPSSDVQGSREETGELPTPRLIIRYPVLYYWAKVGAILGNEEFYLTGLPFWLWAVDSAMIRQMAVVWWLVMYVGQATKDYLGWPRPPSPPVLRLETTHLAEFSMPSTHAMAGTAIPLLVSSLLLERYQLPVVPVLCIAMLWWATTCLSRLYLGVHTVLDVVCGVLLSLGIYILLGPLIPRYDHYQQTHFLAPVILIITSLALCTVCYPSNSKHSAKGDAIIITAVVVGVGISAWLNYHLGLSVVTPKPVRLPVPAPSLAWFGKSVLQFVVGVAVVFTLKVVLKPLMVRFFSVFYGLERVDAEHPGVMVGYKYSTYLCLGLAIAFLDPLLFTTLGFGRPGYYTEMF